jgi:mannonate dehydratase
MPRRAFLKLAAGAAAAGAIWTPLETRAASKLTPLPRGIKVSLQISGDASDEDLRFAQQLGVEYVNIPSGGDRATLENFTRLKQKVEAAGLKVWNIGNSNVHNMQEVTLNLPGRDQKIEEYKNYLRNLAKAGIFYTTYAHMGNGIWSSERETTRGGAPARAFDMDKNPKGNWAGKVFEGALTHGRKYTKEELWDNYTYFIKQVVPVAEELGIRIGIHPDDPPVPATSGRLRSPTAQTSASVSAPGRGWKAASTWARMCSKQRALLRRWTSSGRFTSATSARRSRAL